MLVIRSMKPQDAEAIARLEKESFSDAWSEKSILDTYHHGQAFIVVGEQQDKIVGYCIIYYVLDEGEIARIAVDGSCRRQGVGRELLNQVTAMCLEKGIERILLDVRESNATARAFYRSYGFGEDGIRKNFYEGPREHAVLMSKEIREGFTV